MSNSSKEIAFRRKKMLRTDIWTDGQDKTNMLLQILRIETCR